MQRTALLIALTIGAAVPAAGVDRVKIRGERSEPGDIVRTSKTAVTLEQAAGSREIPVVQIESMLFDGEPAALAQARMNARNGGYATALERLEGVKLARGERDLIAQDLAFYKAYCRAQIALTGGGDAGAAAAALIAFVKSAGDTPHYFESVELIGQLAAAVGRYDQAQKMFATLSKAPFPPLKVRALVRSGEALNASGDASAAIKRFDQALQRAASLPEEAFAASLGKAQSLAATARIAESIDLLAAVLAGLDQEDTLRHALAYNTLGRCYETAEQPRDALYAYLHTDLMFDRDPPTHAEALARLAELWREAGKPDTAREAAARLRREYPRTRWARDAG